MKKTGGKVLDKDETRFAMDRINLQMKYAVLLFLFPVNMQLSVMAQQKTDSLILHFWDSLYVSEPVIQDKEAELIPFVIDEMPAFMELLSGCSSASLVADVYSSVMAKAEDAGAESLWYCMRDMAEDYFHGSNSVFRNDEIYIPLLERLMASRYMSESDSIRYGFQLKMMKKNRIGDSAADIDLRIYRMGHSEHLEELGVETGQKMKLSEVCGDSAFVLFYDPACEHCLHQIEEFRNDEHIISLRKEDALRMILINVEPKNKHKGGGRKCLEQIPEGWIFAKDYKREVVKNQAYYLPFIPQLYVLGKGMKVVGRQ
ncbi:MAG: DUF5106 domain-containing protein [Prevotellaceae bacterium]|nr:DUF5106 domain-containing protein [Prevotellaceae bacterium]